MLLFRFYIFRCLHQPDELASVAFLVLAFRLSGDIENLVKAGFILKFGFAHQQSPFRDTCSETGVFRGTLERLDRAAQRNREQFAYILLRLFVAELYGEDFAGSGGSRVYRCFLVLQFVYSWHFFGGTSRNDFIEGRYGMSLSQFARVFLVVVEIFVFQQTAFVSYKAVGFYFQRIEFKLEFYIFRYGEQCSAHLRYQYFGCFKE